MTSVSNDEQKHYEYVLEHINEVVSATIVYLSNKKQNFIINDEDSDYVKSSKMTAKYIKDNFQIEVENFQNYLETHHELEHLQLVSEIYVGKIETRENKIYTKPFPEEIQTKINLATLQTIKELNYHEE
jgi:DNA-directed RNA polymerase alpha subunit